MADGLEVTGIGKIAWKFEACDESEIQIITDCYYVPYGKARLLSPQRVINEQQGLSGFHKGDGKFFLLCLEGLPSIDIPIIVLMGFLLQWLLQENVRLL